ncbi:MAG TPA: zf-HC2 domain-containing protein [Candidatus Tectomicrobia bacterium]|nr:zf-HC2 domain-containing protein [Candidatus Tectomicrobia bacterium]
MDCQTVHEHLSIYLDHAAPPQTRLVLDQHLAACPLCCRELTQLRTMTAWVGDFPFMEPSPMFLQHVCERVEHLPHRSWPTFFRRLFAALPLQMAAALALVVSAALVWQMTPALWREEAAEVEPPAHIEPRMSHERGVSPILEVPPFEPTLEESFPTPVPLVQGAPRWPGLDPREAFVRVGHELPPMPLLAGIPTQGRANEISFFPSLTLRAVDPVQTAQQIWELVPTTGGELLHSQGMVTPADRASHGLVRLTLAITADRYQALLAAIHQLPGTAVTEERMAIIGREMPLGSPVSLRRIAHAQPARATLMTLVMTILPR